MLDFFLAYSSTLKMEATYSSETSVDFQRTTERYIPEDGLIILSERWKTNYVQMYITGIGNNIKMRLKEID
jgi:hypothetical protein